MTATLITGCGKSKEAAFPDPEKTITLIVPQGAGGGTDTQARQLVEAMKEVSGNNDASGNFAMTSRVLLARG